MTPHALEQQALSRLSAYGFSARYGAEIECYIAFKQRDALRIHAFFAPVLAICAEYHIPLLRIEEERGEGQFEIVLGVYEDPSALTEALLLVKAELLKRGREEGIDVSFAAKPTATQPGSSLQFHVNLMHNGENAFHKNDDYISDALRYALGGLCALTPHVMHVLCPTDEGFLRFTSGADHVPSTACWGSNNRSCAVRIPYTPVWENKRIEWRVAGADAVPEQVLALMLHGIACGIDERVEPPPQTYGLAHKEQEAVPLPCTMHQAMQQLQLLPSLFAPLTAEMLINWSRL